MAGRIYNFSAGPAALPESVLRQAQKDIWDIFDSGIGILEHSHRGPVFDRVLEETLADCREVGSIPDDYEAFFVQGGATTQCFMVPANLLPADRTADYFNTGKWASDSIKEAPLYGGLHVCASSKESGYDHIPTGKEVSHSDNPVYVHFTSNNTIVGTEFPEEPTPPKDAFLVCDASSNIYSKPIDVRKYGLIYAGAQKNLGPAGAVLIIARKDVVAEPVRELPTMLRYNTHVKGESRYNTPPTFAIYLAGQVFKWILAEGGLKAMAERNREKAAVIYDFLDAEPFYDPHAKPDSRSLMNITFRTPTPELDALFIVEAQKRGLDGLAGHRMVGGMRASIYNAFPKVGCDALVEFMKDFARQHKGAAQGVAAAGRA